MYANKKHGNKRKENSQFNHALYLGKVAGIDIDIHSSWILALILIVWTLAAGYFPQKFPGWSTGTYWLTGFIAALVLFASVLIHELSHSLVAKARGMPVSGITLFIFGGMSRIESEAEKPWDEFAMAVVGPLTSLILAGVFWGLRILIGGQGTPLLAILTYLAVINAILAIFNMLPGFPLDGGRVLRSIVWKFTRDRVSATNIASLVGQALAWFFIFIGFLNFMGGNLLGGLWIAFIGWFLNNAALSSRQMETFQHYMKGVIVGDISHSHPEIVDSGLSVGDLVRDFFLQHGVRAALVNQNGEIAGIVTLRDVKKHNEVNWDQARVGEIMKTTPFLTVDVTDDLNKALQMLASHDVNQLVVTRDGKIEGLLTRADVIKFLQIRRELELSSQN